MSPFIPPTARRGRIADLDFALSRYVQSSYETALQVVLRERFENMDPVSLAPKELEIVASQVA